MNEAISAALERADTTDADVVDVDIVADAELDILLEEEDGPPAVLEGLQKLLAAPVEEMADASRDGMAQLNFKKTGSVSYDRKHKSLRERWFTKKPTDDNDDADDDVDPLEKVIRRNMHVKLEISEGRGAAKRTAVEDYRVLAIYTKTYNKWFLCEKGRQMWKKGIKKGEYRVLVRMVQFDHLMGKYKDCVPTGFVKWGKKRMFILCDASSIVDVVQMLGTD